MNSKLIDIAEIHRRAQASDPKTRPLAQFFQSTGHTKAFNHLKYDLNLDADAIMQRSKPSRGNPSVIKVHFLMALEFVRWLDYSRYVKMVSKLLR